MPEDILIKKEDIRTMKKDIARLQQRTAGIGVPQERAAELKIEEEKKRKSEQMTGRIFSPEHRANLSAAMKGKSRPQTEETKR